MAFKLKSVSEVFGINEEASEYGTPVFEKDLDPGIIGEANRDGTIFVKKGLSQKEINKAVAHEKVHIDQIKRGDLTYDDKNIYWKGKKYSRKYNKKSPWEKEAYKKQK